MFNSEEIQSSLGPKSQGTDYETANYPPEHDSTSSGGSGSPEDAWSAPAQRGKHFPAHLTGVHPTSPSPTTTYSPDPFTPPNSSGLPITSPSTPVPTIPATATSADLGSVPDSWESRNEALQRLNQRYRDNTDVKDI